VFDKTVIAYVESRLPDGIVGISEWPVSAQCDTFIRGTGLIVVKENSSPVNRR